jgi:hypothetical protein
MSETTGQPHPDPPSRQDGLALGGLAALVLGAGWLYAGAGVTNCDEWTFVHDGLRLLRGEVIYRDYFQFTPPGTAWLAALGQALCGPGVLGPRLLQEASLLATALLFFGLARQLGCGPWLATLPALAPALALHRWIPSFNHHWLVLPWLAGALWLALQALERGSWRRWAAAGACTGAATLVLQSDGLVLAIALGLVLGLEVILGATPRRSLAAGAAALTGGLAAVGLAAAGWLAWHGALSAAWRDCWLWPLAQYRTPGGFNDIPLATDLAVRLSPFDPALAMPFKLWFYAKLYHLGTLYGLYVGAPALALTWGLGLLARRVREGGGWSARERAHALMGLLAIGLVAATLRGRVDVIHVVTYVWPSLLLAASTAAWALRRPWPEALVLWRPVPALALAALVGSGAVLWAGDVRRAPDRWGQGLVADRLLADVAGVHWLRERVRPGDRLTAWPYAGYWGVYAAPVVGRWNHMTAPHMGYYAPGEFDRYWAGVLRDRPRFVIWAPLAPITPAYRRADWPHPLPGYRKVATLPHRTFSLTGATLDAEIYERESK